jgi:hypothetical protein
MDHWAADGLVGAYYGDFSHNLVSGVKTNLVGASRVVNQRGLATQVANSTENRIDTNEYLFTGAENRTVIMGIDVAGSIDASPSFFSAGSHASGQRWDFRLLFGDMRIEIGGGGYTSSLTVPTGYSIVGVTLDGGTLGGHRFFLNKDSQGASGSNSINTGTTYTARMLDSILSSAISSNDRNVYDSPTNFCWVWNKALTEELYHRIRRDPYMFLVPG